MADELKWQGSGYSPEKAWAKIKRDDSRRRAAARVGWRENLAAFGLFSWMALCLVIFFGCIAALLFRFL